MNSTGSVTSLPARVSVVTRTGSGRRPRALSPSRQAIAALLRGQPEPLSIAALAKMTQLHENTIREHLDGLIARGLVVRTRSMPAGRGRPAWLYAHVDDDVITSEFVECVDTLTRALTQADEDEHETVAEEQGRAWGRGLAAARGFVAEDVDLAHEQLEQLLHELNFSPIPHDEAPGRTRLRHCPALEAAVRADGIVCQLHVGLLRGLFEGGGNAELARNVDLEPFAEPGACIMKLSGTTYGPAPSTN